MYDTTMIQHAAAVRRLSVISLFFVCFSQQLAHPKSNIIYGGTAVVLCVVPVYCKAVQLQVNIIEELFPWFFSVGFVYFFLDSSSRI